MITGILIGSYFTIGIIMTIIVCFLAVLGNEAGTAILAFLTCWFAWPIWLLGMITGKL